MNTGRVGGKDDDDRSKKVKIPHTSACVKAIAEGTITWVKDPDFGYLVAETGAGHRRRRAAATARLYERQGRRRRSTRRWSTG